MADQRAFLRLAAAVNEESTFLSAAGRSPGLDAELRKLGLEEIWASTLIAGSTLSFEETTTLVERGVATGDHTLEYYVLVSDYAAAARFVSAAPPPGRRNVFLRLEEIVTLHALAARREPEAHPGAWRTTTARALPSGVVPPPAWLVPRELSAFVEREALGPGAQTEPLAWVAGAHQRFARIHPFERANGRVVRLLTNLLLARLGLPPFAVRGRAAARYLAALRRADSRDPWPLAATFAGAVLSSLRRLVAAGESNAELRSVAEFATGPRRAALYKAAQRGRLRTVRRAGTLYTSGPWIAEYEASRGARRRPR
jgi:Fic family protein